MTIGKLPLHFQRMFQDYRMTLGGRFASDYDGTNDYALRGADLTGIADGKQGLISAWCRVDGNDGAEFAMLSSSRFIFNRNDVPGAFTVRAANSAGSTILSISTVGTFLTSATWVHFLASWNLATAGARHIYISDVSDLAVTTFTNDTIDYTTGNYAIGGGVAGIGSGSLGADRYDGCLSEFFFHTAYLDLSVTANRRRFITASGKPARLFQNGALPLGVQPLIYAPNGDPSTNRGSGGNFAITGALSAASSVPST